MNRLRTTIYTKTLTRDFSLPWIQIWYKGEAKNPKPWNNQYNQSFPYLVFIRRDDTVTSYYDPTGLRWQRWSCLSEIKKNGGFQNVIISHIKEHLAGINVLLKKHIVKQKDELLYLFDLFKKAYPWFQAMWDATSDDKLAAFVDISIIRAFRASIETFNDDLDNTINQSLREIFPAIADFTHVLTIQEIKSGNLPTILVLQKRDQGFIYTDERLFEIQDLEAIEKKYNIELEKENIIKISIIKGDVASQGKTKGIVRRIMGLRNIKDFKEGEILVTPMTMPDFLPAMKKAAAFITDEGGIICHAAILARELKKPCIVGTKIATSVLKNGDIVEIDAIKGVIKILDK